MSLKAETVNNSAIDDVVQSSLENDYNKLIWVPCSQITNIEPTQSDNVYYAKQADDNKTIILLCLGSSDECTPTLVSEFARIYSLPTHKHKNIGSNFGRYSKWLEERNKIIKGFTKYEDNYYMVADKLFYHCYSRYGFCAACGILRCSPVWCICGHKQLSDGWTGNNKQLDKFIKKSQLQTTSPNQAYLEWIPFDCISMNDCDKETYFYGLPTYVRVTFEITDETHDLYYAEVNYILMRRVC